MEILLQYDICVSYVYVRFMYTSLSLSLSLSLSHKTARKSHFRYISDTQVAFPILVAAHKLHSRYLYLLSRSHNTYRRRFLLAPLFFTCTIKVYSALQMNNKKQVTRYPRDAPRAISFSMCVFPRRHETFHVRAMPIVCRHITHPSIHSGRGSRVDVVNREVLDAVASPEGYSNPSSLSVLHVCTSESARKNFHTRIFIFSYVFMRVCLQNTRERAEGSGKRACAFDQPRSAGVVVIHLVIWGSSDPSSDWRDMSRVTCHA